MAKMGKGGYDEISKFIREVEAAGTIETDESAAPVAKAGQAASDLATRLKRKGTTSSTGTVMRDIEEKQEAGGLISSMPVSPRVTRELVDTGSDVNMLEMLAAQQGMEYVRLPDIQIDPEAVALFSADFARENRCLPLFLKPDGSMVVAISDPLNVMIVDNLRLLLDRPIEAVVTSEADIVDYIDQYFSHADDIDKLMEDLEREGGVALAASGSEYELDPEALVHAAPVIKLVNLILMRALKDRASDLHIEPFGTTLRIRYRVDGVLRELAPPPKSLQLGLCSRLKVMANMNISETRRPQDGRIRLTHQGREVDLRVSSLPTVHGESIVMRILDKQQMMVGIEQIGMTRSVMTRFVDICKRPNGIVLVTGPTGCGKTTTLYAAITNRLNPEEKFITTEDPVEYEVPGLVQVNINTAVGLTFAACLRAILRQDPDVILVGEIRDVETATISIQAALTGHLVYSTLHTNSATGTISRLIDMGVEPFLLTSTLQVVIGQRLIRTICQACRETYNPSAAELEEFCLRHEDIAGLTFYRGSGCDECGHSGYRGRLGLFEMLEITDEIRDLILDRATSDDLQEHAFNAGMQTMRQDGLIKVCMGVTTFSEVAHHTPFNQPDEIKREVMPIIQQVRQRLVGQAPGAAPGDPRARSIAAEATRREPILPPPAAPKPIEPLHGLPQLPPLPGMGGGPSHPEAATYVSADPLGVGAAARDESAMLPAEEDALSFLSSSALEDQTPYAEPDMPDFGTLEGLEPFDLGDDEKK